MADDQESSFPSAERTLPGANVHFPTAMRRSSTTQYQVIIGRAHSVHNGLKPISVTTTAMDTTTRKFEVRSESV